MSDNRKFSPPWDQIPIGQQIWRNQFIQDRLAVEIGAGAGFHAINFCKSNPEYFLIAIEKTSEKFNKLNRRFQNHPNIVNLHPVQANAIDWIYCNLFENEVDEYFILYPNPYPKASQQNKRFTDIPFMDYLFSTLKSGGKITLATNMEYYALEAKEAWRKRDDLKLEDYKLINDIKDFKPRTHFEKKYLERGENCFNLVFKKL